LKEDLGKDKIGKMKKGRRTWEKGKIGKTKQGRTWEETKLEKRRVDDTNKYCFKTMQKSRHVGGRH
jgi:hypothetical protein